MSRFILSTLSLLMFTASLMGSEFAAANSPEPDGKDQSTDYFTFDDSSPADDALKFVTPDRMLMEVQPLFQTLADAITLLKWVKHDQVPPMPSEKYNRLKDFGTWAVDPNGEHTCLNTRAYTLIRDSQVQVTMDSADPCVVGEGQWDDPYTGNTVTEAKQLQIDHVVPLKNAFQTGAANWTPQRRCHYANFMANEYHLLSVSAHENMSKGDRTPAQYLPPNEGFVCTYIQRWLKIKMIWGLIMTGEEAQGISEAIRQHGCENTEMKLTKAELQQMRMASEDLGVCAEFPFPPPDGRSH